MFSFVARPSTGVWSHPGVAVTHQPHEVAPSRSCPNRTPALGETGVLIRLVAGAGFEPATFGFVPRVAHDCLYNNKIFVAANSLLTLLLGAMQDVK